MERDKWLSNSTRQRLLLGLCLSAFLSIILLLFGKVHLIIFIALLVASYKLTDYYVCALDRVENTPACWPNLLVLIKPTEDLEKEKLRKQCGSCHYTQKNPWVHLMLSKRIDTAIDEFCCLCLRDHVYPWLSLITHDDTLVHEAKNVFRYLLATVIRRLQNVDINTFVLHRLLPLLFDTADRYLQTLRSQSSRESLSSTDFLTKIYGKDVHIAMFSRSSELKYLKRLVLDLMPLVTPKFIYECKGARHFLREIVVCQILLDGIDAICEPETLNRLFHLYFTTAIHRRNSPQLPPSVNSDVSVELLSHFCVMNGPLHKNQLALELTDVMYEKELLNQFSRVLDRHGSIGLLSIYVTLSDLLNDIPSASNVLVRRKISQRLKGIDERYLNLWNTDAFVNVCQPADPLIGEIKDLIYTHLENSLEENDTHFDLQHTFALLSRFHCKIYELVEENYQRCFLNSDEHFLYICARRMDSPDYRMIEQKHGANQKRNVGKRYTTTSYKELEEKDDVHFKCPDDTTSIGSNSSHDDKDLNTWRIHISHAEELRDSATSNNKHAAFIIEVQRLDFNSDNPLLNDEEKTHWVVARRYQDFYLLEQKLTEFHGVFSDARLPARRSATTARNLEFLQSIKKDFEHFLRHLLSKPTLRNSELLYNFLTQPDEFTLPNGEIILSKMFKVVPRRLRIEKGQYLDPFLISLINYAEAAKPKASQSAPVFPDIVSEKLRTTIYGNNADLTKPINEKVVTEHGEDSAYDQLMVVAKQVFSASPLLIYLLNLLRVPLKNSFDTFFSHFVDENVDELLADEENIIDVIHALRDAIFPNDAEKKGPTDMANFDDVVAAAEEYLPKPIKLVLGKSNVHQGLQTILQYFQDPLLNKHSFYMILDEVLLQLFPELQAHSDGPIC